MSNETKLIDTLREEARTKSGKSVHASRDAFRRPPLAMDLGSRFNIPQAIKEADPDYVYGFVPDKSDEGYDKLEQAESLGWKLVKADELPEASKTYFSYSLRNNSDGLLRKSGQVMMKIHKDDKALIDEYYDRQTKEQEEEVKKASQYQDQNIGHPSVTQNANYFG